MIEFSNKCTKCGRQISQGVASYSFHAFGIELCQACQAVVRFDLKATNSKVLVSEARKPLESASQSLEEIKLADAKGI